MLRLSSFYSSSPIKISHKQQFFPSQQLLADFHRFFHGPVSYTHLPGLKPRATVNKIPAKEGMKSNTNNLTTQFFIIQY